MKLKPLLLIIIFIIFSGCSISDNISQIKESEQLKKDTEANINDYYATFSIIQNSCNVENMAVGKEIILGSLQVKTNGLTSVEKYPLIFKYTLASGKINGYVQFENEKIKKAVKSPFWMEGNNEYKLEKTLGDFSLKEATYNLIYTPTSVENIQLGQNSITTTFPVDEWLITANEETEKPVPASSIKKEGDLSITCNF